MLYYSKFMFYVTGYPHLENMSSLDINWYFSTSQDVAVIGLVLPHEFHGLWKFKAFPETPAVFK